MSFDGSLKFDTKIDESGFSSGINKLGGIAKGGLAVLGGLAAGAVTAFGVVTKSALDSVASLEQNIGGVETLFKDSADAVIANAKRAYQTAGMSANEYMSTVTSFSASLLQSLAGNTQAAADVADMAITDMSDNANKMGTSMESIQNAYQGFAKQNYTMLDNLKLGYGGTKTEMERLLKKAQELTGVEYDISNLSDVYEAIHAIQVDLGISGISAEEAAKAVASGAMTEKEAFEAMGTTAKEAATTIEGSMSSAKAAWDNFLNGSGDAEQLAESVATAGVVIGKNLGQIIPRLLKTIPATISELGAETIEAFKEFDIDGAIESGKNVVSDFVNGITDSLPSVLDGSSKLISHLLKGIKDSAPSVTANAGELIKSLVTGIQENVPGMLTAAVDLIAAFADGIVEQIPGLVPLTLQTVVTLADGILENIPTIVNAGLSLLTGLVQGIIEGLPVLLAEGPRLINDFANTIFATLGPILTTGAQLLLTLVNGIISNLPAIAGAAVSSISSFAGMIVSNLPRILQTGITLLGQLAAGIISAVPNLVGKIPQIITSIKNAFTRTDWGSIGLNIIKGIAIGLANAGGLIAEAAKGAAKKAFDAARNFLDINSPSRLFRDVIGKNMALGMAIGFDEDIPAKAVEDGLDHVMKRAGKKVASINRSIPETTKGIISKVTNNYTGNGINYKKIKQAQKEALNEANERPIILNGRQVNRSIRDGEVVPV